MNREEWLSVLKLSTLWEFEELRKKAIAELSKVEIEAVDKVIFARSYRVGTWLFEGYKALVEREASLSSEEAERLGYKTAFQLCLRREDTFRRRGGIKSYRSFNGVEPDICETFRTELIDTGHSGKVPQMHFVNFTIG
jgi:hypothetical protein